MARSSAGYSLGGADLCSRAMGKDGRPEEMAQHRSISREGARRENGLDSGQGGRNLDLMEKLAGYGFNKSPQARASGWFRPSRRFTSRRIHPAALMAAQCRPTWTIPTGGPAIP